MSGTDLSGLISGASEEAWSQVLEATTIWYTDD